MSQPITTFDIRDLLPTKMSATEIVTISDSNLLGEVMAVKTQGPIAMVAIYVKTQKTTYFCVNLHTTAKNNTKKDLIAIQIIIQKLINLSLVGD